MKTKFHLIASLLAIAVTAHAGPISKGGFIISKPGKYFLTKSIGAAVAPGFNSPVGILIAAEDVELDLAGFSIGPVNNLGIGIFLMGGVKHARIHNGRIQGVQYAVLSENNKKINSCLFERLQIADCTVNAIDIEGSENVIRSCTLTNIAQGHHGIVVHTTLGRFNEVSDCTVCGVAGGGDTGINADTTDGLVVRRCVVDCFEEGFHVTTKCKLMDNLTFHCNTPFAGNPILIGTNN